MALVRFQIRKLVFDSGGAEHSEYLGIDAAGRGNRLQSIQVKRAGGLNWTECKEFAKDDERWKEAPIAVVRDW